MLGWNKQHLGWNKQHLFVINPLIQRLPPRRQAKLVEIIISSQQGGEKKNSGLRWCNCFLLQHMRLFMVWKWRTELWPWLHHIPWNVQYILNILNKHEMIGQLEGNPMMMSISSPWYRTAPRNHTSSLMRIYVYLEPFRCVPYWRGLTL